MGYRFAAGVQGAPDEEIRKRMIQARERVSIFVASTLELDHSDAMTRLKLWGWIGLASANVTRWLESPDVNRDELVGWLAESARRLLG